MHTSSTNRSEKINFQTIPAAKENSGHQPSICNVELKYLTNIELEAMNSSGMLKLYLKVFIVLFINGKVNIELFNVGKDFGVKWKRKNLQKR